MKKLLIILIAGTAISCGESKEEKNKRIQDSLADVVAAFDRFRDARQTNFEQSQELIASEGMLRISYLNRPGAKQKFKDSINARFDYRRDSIQKAFDSMLALDSIRIFRGGR